MSPVAAIAAVIVMNAVAVWAMLARFRWEQRRDAKAATSFDRHAEDAVRLVREWKP